MRYDISWHSISLPTLVPHFCRQWDENGGCYGTNPDHGYSIEEGISQIAQWHLGQAQSWLDGTHPDIPRETVHDRD